MFLKKSTAVTIRMGPALDKTDGVTEETALSPTVEISKNGAAFVSRNSTGAITHDSNGWYAVSMSSCDTNTVGKIITKFDDSATHLPVWHDFHVLPASTFDSLFSTNSSGFNSSQQVIVGSLATGAITAAAIASDAFGAAELAADAVNEIADGILDRNMTTGTDSGSPTVRTMRQALRFLRNRWAIAGGTLTVYKEDDATASWTSTITTAAGNPVSESNPPDA